MSQRHPNPTSSSPTRGQSTVSRLARQTAIWPALAVGLIAGLLLGLALGWTVWPVQWVNAWPGDLNPEARAHYIAAVADAYTYIGDDRAAEVASRRLYDLNNNLAAEIAAAQSYFTDNPQQESRTYIVNMARLAQALNVQSPDIIQDPDAPAIAASEAPPPGLISPGLMDWLNWIFVIIAAVVLIVGGIYIVYERSRRRQAQEVDTIFADEDEEVGGFEEDDWDSEDDDSAVYRRPLTAIVGTPGGAPPEGDAYFDDDLDEDLENRSAALEPAASRDTGIPQTVQTRPATAPDLDYDDFDDVEDDYDDEYEDEDESSGRPQFEEETPATPARTQQARPGQAIAAAAATSPDRAEASEILGEYTVQYLAGLLDYDEPHDIVDSVTGRIIGECGMGVNMKNGYLQNNPEHVIALDVYLFDKKDDTRILSQNRILLCEYVIDNKLEHAFSKERPNDPPPLVAQPDTTFQLTGNSMVMDCEVLEVDYVKDGDAKGIFQNLKLRLTVRDKVEL
jgi:hypothetical protein